MIAALYVDPTGPYFGLPDVDPWDEKRDARSYNGPHPVVVHPPCQRWGRFAEGSPTNKRFKIGDDGGCCAHAVASVRRFGGAFEHPQGSYAFEWFGMPVPSGRGWTKPDAFGGRSAYIDQGAYGHRAKKPTWIYAVLPTYPKLNWERVWDRPLIGGTGCHNARELNKWKARSDYKPVEKLSKRERILTPPAFRDLMVDLAASCVGWTPPGPKNLQAVLA